MKGIVSAVLVPKMSPKCKGGERLQNEARQADSVAVALSHSFLRWFHMKQRLTNAGGNVFSKFIFPGNFPHSMSSPRLIHCVLR